MVGTGSEPEPRDVAPDPQHSRLSRRDRRRSVDADSRSRRDHADPHRCGVGLAHADPSHLRPRGTAPRLLDSLHGDRRGLCELLAAWRGVAAADRPWRCRRRRAGANACRGVRPGRFRLPAGARHHTVRGDVRGVPVCKRLGFASEGRGADADRGRRHALRRGGRSQLGVARMGLPRPDERQGTDRMADEHGLSLAGIEFAAGADAFVPAPGADPERPRRAVPGPEGRGGRKRKKTRRRRKRKKRRRLRPRARRPRHVQLPAKPKNSNCRRFRC